MQRELLPGLRRFFYFYFLFYFFFGSEYLLVGQLTALRCCL